MMSSPSAGSGAPRVWLEVLRGVRHHFLPESDAPTTTSMYRVNATTRLRASMEWLRRRFLLLVGAPTALALTVGGAAYYWSSARFVVSTGRVFPN